MNRITFLFLALLIASCILTVNSRHETRTVITEKSVLNERVNSLQETIRRLELDKARLAAKGGAEEETCEVAPETAASPLALEAEGGPAQAPAPVAAAAKVPAVLATAETTAPAKALTVAAAPTLNAAAPAAKAKATAKAADLEDDPLAAALAKMEAKAKAKAEKN